MTDGLDREAVERARFIARTTGLEDRHARAVALAEQGYSDHGIADVLDVTPGTATKWLDDVADRFGTEAVHPTPADERGALTPDHTDDPPGVAVVDATRRVVVEAEAEPAGAHLERYYRTWIDDYTVHRQQKVAVRPTAYDERTSDRLGALDWDEHHATWTDDYEFASEPTDEGGAWTADATQETVAAVREAGVPVPPLDQLALVVQTWPWRPDDGRTCPVCGADQVASEADLTAYPSVDRLAVVETVRASPAVTHVCLGCRRPLVHDTDDEDADHDLADGLAEVMA
jgi:hypothetical protein